MEKMMKNNQNESFHKKNYLSPVEDVVRIQRLYGEDISEQLTQRFAYDYLDKYVDEISNFQEKTFEKKNFSVVPNRTIFTMWLQGIDCASDIVKACILSQKKIERKHIVLCEESIEDYITLPDYIWEKYKKGIISKAHFSDVVRIFLLEQYGGVWMDATAYVAETPPDYMINGFWAFKQSPQLKQVRQSGNWWLSADQGDEIIRLMKIMYCLYWKYEDKLLHYYLFHIMWMKIINKFPDLEKRWKKIIPRYTDTTHFLATMANEKFDSEIWDEMKKISPVYKCTWKLGESFIKGSYFDLLARNELP